MTATRIERPDHVARLIETATACGWRWEERRGNGVIERAVAMVHPDHPRLSVGLLALTVQPYFRGMVYADRKLLAEMASAKDVRSVLEQPAAVLQGTTQGASEMSETPTKTRRGLAGDPRYAEAYEAKAKGQRGPGKKVTDDEMRERIVAALADDPEANVNGERERAYWLDGWALSAPRWASVWEDVAAGKPAPAPKAQAPAPEPQASPQAEQQPTKAEKVKAASQAVKDRAAVHAAENGQPVTQDTGSLSKAGLLALARELKVKVSREARASKPALKALVDAKLAEQK